jgi:hypothetical protein
MSCVTINAMDSGTRESTLSRIGFPILLLLISVVFYWKLVLTDEYTWYDHPDMAYLEIPRLGFQAREIHNGNFPLWNPRLWAGQPLIGQTQPGPLFPLNLLLYLLPLRDGYLRAGYLNWYFVVVHFLSALFCYWLARDLGRSRGASLAAGCAFAFGGFVGTVGAEQGGVAGGGMRVCVRWVCRYGGVAGCDEWRDLDAAGVAVCAAGVAGGAAAG